MKRTITLVLLTLLALLASGCADKVVSSGEFTLQSGETLNGDLEIKSGNVTLEEGSRVTCDVIMKSGKLHANGEIDGDIVMSSGDLYLGPKAIVHGDIENTSGNIHRAEGSRIEREGGTSTESIAGIIGRDRRMYERNNMAGQPIDYAAAKAGIIGMTKDLAAFLGPSGVCVNAISPGGFNRNLPDGFVKDYCDRTPLHAMGRDGIDLKGPILFLASPASDYVTAQNLVVDGGFTVWQ